MSSCTYGKLAEQVCIPVSFKGKLYHSNCLRLVDIVVLDCLFQPDNVRFVAYSGADLYEQV